ncbi:PTS sugar transporter subunit IIB [Enorma burkinafasonensis]|uniref:PTS sugar transporter subunit IIB n=1 Tax=Enorma burkinafasonensis TaxID=2590867 RepID=UPI0026EF7686|nr:PTS sugar transporter subunit IIB [Enorma burkinafasonensis]MCI7730510.1 PTS sugar transporter subunit IIB [Enorma burkinafasonensis]
MTNILLVCAAGASTSMLADKMQKEAASRGLEVTVRAVAEQQAALEGGDADVVLVGPQMRFKVDSIKAMFPDKPVTDIDMRAYGMMDASKVLDTAFGLIG